MQKFILHHYVGARTEDPIPDGSMRYVSYDFECSLGFTFHTNDHNLDRSRFISSTLTSTLFSIIPAVFCIYYYYQSVSVLLTRKKKVGRNLNLIFCFATICFIWCITFFLRYAFFLYLFVFSLKVPLRREYQYPLLRSLYMRFILNNSSSISSVLNPFLFILAQTDYRKPFLKRKEKLLKKLWSS